MPPKKQTTHNISCK